MSHLQLTLGLGLRDDATFDNFYPGNNAQVIAVLKDFLIYHNEQFLYLYGAEGVGCSHLLQACCHSLSDQSIPVAYLPLRDNQDLAPAILDDMEQLSLVCLDDIDGVLGQANWEEALFHFYNRVRENKTRLLVSAKKPPQQLSCQLADLQSRLAWGLSLLLQSLTDEQLLLALQMRAHHRGLWLSREVGQYLLRRYPRDMKALFQVLEKLDRASMVEKKRLTVPFVRRVLG